MIEEALRRWAEARKARFAVAGVDVLDKVGAKLDERRDAGQIDGALFREYMSGFRYREDCGVAGPEAVLLVSLRCPTHVVTFELDGRTFDGLLPPTYYRYQPVFADVRTELRIVLGEGVPIGLLKAPLKSLSVIMGLSRYGRNNVTYVPGFGSGHQLCGYAVGGETGRRLREAFARPETPLETPLDRCAGCRACANACPAGAFKEDVFLLSAEKCNTVASEARGALRDGIRSAGPACLVGCLACQVVCPENKGKLLTERLDIVFTDPETRALLDLGRLEAAGKGKASRTAPSGVAPSLWAAVIEKYDRLQLTEDIEGFARNLLPIVKLC
jgi:epoxyqueuosine reductase